MNIKESGEKKQGEKKKYISVVRALSLSSLYSCSRPIHSCNTAKTKSTYMHSGQQQKYQISEKHRKMVLFHLFIFQSCFSYFFFFFLTDDVADEDEKNKRIQTEEHQLHVENK